MAMQKTALPFRRSYKQVLYPKMPLLFSKEKPNRNTLMPGKP